MKVGVLLASFAAAFAAAAEVNLDGETTCAVAGGSATNRISEKVTGTGSILKTGAGVLSLTNPGNDFSGGIVISEGTVSAAAEGVLGSGTVTVSSALSRSAGVHFNAAASSGSYAVFSNPLAFTGDKDVGDYRSLSHSGGYEQTNFNAVFYKNTRLTGDITGTRSFRLRHNPVSTSNPKNGGPSTIFDGALSAVEKSIYLHVYGTMTVNGPVTAKMLWGGEPWSGGGTLALNNSENAIGTIIISHNNLSCGAANVLGGATIAWRLTGESPHPGLSCVNMNGFDQTVAGLSQVVFDNNGWNKAFVHRNVGMNENTYCVTSSEAATLTITGGVENLTTYAPLMGAVSLVIDSQSNSAFVQTFTNNLNTFTGATEVRAGILKITGNARFSKTPSITVAQGASLICASTNSLPALESVKTLAVNGTFDASTAKTAPFSTIESLSLGADASLLLPAGMVLYVKSITVNGQPKTGRLFTPENLPQLKSGTIIVDSVGIDATWTGAESQSLTAAGNWDASPLEFSNGSINATFASAGATAIADDDAVFGSIRFRAAEGENGFAINRGDPEHTVTVLDGISAVTNGADCTAHTYVIDTPLKIAEAITFHADTNQTLTVRNALRETAEDMGKHTITVDGHGPYANRIGSVRFEGTNCFGGKLAMTTSLVRVSGVLSNPGRLYTGVPAGKTAGDIIHIKMNTNNDATRADASKGNMVYGLFLNNATIGKSIWVDSMIGCRSITTESGTTNEVTGYVRYNIYDHQGVETKWNSELILSGGLYGSHSFRKYNSGTLRIRNVPVNCTQSAGFNPEEGRVVFEVPDNTFNYFILGYNYNKTLTVEMTVDNVLTNGLVQIGGSGGDANNCMPLSKGNYTLDVHGTRQRCEKLAVLPRGTLTGEYPAMVEVYDGWHDGNPAGYRYVTGNITGGVGLLHSGTGTLTLTNRAFASCGDLAVTNGTLEFAANATWLNGTNITVAGSGTLRLAKGGHFSRKNAILWFGADEDAWKIDIPAGMSQTFSAAYDADGRRLSAGTYGNAASGATNVRYAGHFPNAGRVNVSYTGTIVSIR